MGKLIARSHSALACHETCPRQYEAKYITKEVEYKQGPEAVFGDAIHKACELGVKSEGRNVFPRFESPNQQFVAKQAQRCVAAVIRRSFTHSARLMAEESIAYTEDWEQTGYFGKNVWLRLKVDVQMIYSQQPRLDILDWKTGKPREDEKQKQLYALDGFMRHPGVEMIATGDVWFKQENPFTPPTIYRRDRDFQFLYDSFMQRNEALDATISAGVFEPRPSGLCNGWCDVTSCPHWRPKR